MVPSQCHDDRRADWKRRKLFAALSLELRRWSDSQTARNVVSRSQRSKRA